MIGWIKMSNTFAGGQMARKVNSELSSRKHFEDLLIAYYLTKMLQQQVAVVRLKLAKWIHFGSPKT
jgi:hypothetical protein